ncbi:MAG: hypothetical protein QW035_01675 [Candidatus Anstonellales archaeon]
MTPTKRFPFEGIHDSMLHQRWIKRKGGRLSENPKKAFKGMGKQERVSLLKEMWQEANIALGKEEMEIVFEGLMDKDQEVNKAAWRVLERMRGMCPAKGDEAVALAREWASNKEAWRNALIRKGVMLILGECGKEKDCNIIWAGLKDSDLEVYSEAMAAFNRLSERGYDLYRFRIA